MKVLVFSEEKASRSHGTGILIQKLMDRPECDVLNAYHFGRIDDLFPNCIRIPRPWFTRKSMNYFGWWGLFLISKLLRHKVSQIIKVRKTLKAFGPDLIYSTAFSSLGLATLAFIRKMVGREIPVIQHFYDWEPEGGELHKDDLRTGALEAPCEIWTLTQPMIPALKSRLGLDSHLVELITTIPAESEDSEYPEIEHLRPILVGNIWLEEAAAALAELGRELNSLAPDRMPFIWYAHPNTFQRITKFGLSLEKVVENGGFFQQSELVKKMRMAPVGLIPIDGTDQCQTNYARFSLPSRIAEFCSAGLPVILLGSRDSAPAEYVLKNELGLVLSPEHPERAARELLDLLEDADRRRLMSERVRFFAEKNLHPDVVIESAWKQLQEVSRSSHP